MCGRIPQSAVEAREFIAGVASAGGSVERSSDLPGTVRAEQPLRSTREPLCALLRPGTSDVAVWNQVVGAEHYAPLVRLLERVVAVEVRTILDLGANIGLSVAYFAAVYPDARIFAVEPDPDSFRLLKENTKTLGVRVRAERAAFWPRREPLRWASERFRDGREWARAVERTRNPGDVDDCGDPIGVITPAEALAHVEAERFDLAKVDIEGAEAAFFATDEDTEALLGLANVFVIELHVESVGRLSAVTALDRSGFLSVPIGDLVLIAIRRETLIGRQEATPV